MTKLRALLSLSARPLTLLSSVFLCSFALSQDVTPISPQPAPEPPLYALADAVPDALTDALPDAPRALTASSSSLGDTYLQQPTGQAPEHTDPQQKRIFGILPNFRSVTAGTVLPRQTIRDKFTTATEDSFDYSSFLLAGLVATYSYGTSATPEFHTGGAAFGRYYWHSFVDQTSENYLVEFIIPSITHEDTRYYSLGKGGFLKRAGYSLSRAFVTRNDDGREVFNAGEIVGAGVSAAISNLYYPSPERTVGNTVDKYGTNVGIDMASFFVKEFYPDIYHVLFHQRIAPGTTAPTTP
jgi:hypothetical protein